MLRPTTFGPRAHIGKAVFLSAKPRDPDIDVVSDPLTRSWKSLDTIAKNGDACDMRYDGGKGTCYAQLINLIPPHQRYIETHLGGGAVMRYKKPALEQYGIERDHAVVEMWERELKDHCKLLHGDAIDCLEALPVDSNTFVYSDPPYHPDTRRRARVYKHDYSVEDHVRLLDCLTKLPCDVLISGYTSPLYEQRLATWNKHKFLVRTRVGMREECVWFNYAKPDIPHDDRYLGDDFRQREVIRRRQSRLRQRVEKLSRAEQASLHAWLGEIITNESAI